MAMDMSKNGNALLQAYNDVVSDKKDTDWVVFGYEGNTNILKVYETGDGGIEEMVDELNSGKIMYAYCRVKDPNTDLPKYVLINWQGEGAPESVKLKCTQHIKDMTSWLRTVHVTINARTDDDVEADDVMKKVAKASGANYSFHKEKARPVEAPTPVGSVYKKTVAAKDIRGSSRDEFWAKTEKEEHERQEVERKRKMSENEQMEKERKEREAREAKERDQRMIDRMKAVNEQKRAEKQASMVNRENEKNKWDKEQQDMLHDDEERRKRSESLRKERVMEAQALTSSSASSARDFFKQKSVERPDDASRRAPPPPKKLQHGFLSQEEEPEPQRKAPIQLPKDEPSSPPPSKPARQPEPEPEPEYEPEPVYQTEPEPVAEPAPELPQTRNLLQQGLPPRQDSDEEEEEQNWEEPSAEDNTPSSSSGQVISTSAGNVHEEVEYEGIQNMPGGDKGLCATALYDYQAADESEITFDPGDIITNIEQIDAGWWTGTGPDGSVGMFPANYVELIE